MKVSICCITYNHAKYIGKAIESFLEQKVDFEYEIVIGEDCSSDDTLKICELYAKKYSQIKLLPKEQNLGMMNNFIRTLNACKGEYIALCEGDDYWVDPLKLQKQVDFLEISPSYTMSFHQVNVKNEIEGLIYKYPIPTKNTLSFKDIFRTHYIPTCSLILRRSAIPSPLPDWFENCGIGDIPLELLVADKGMTKYFPNKMATYRKNNASITLDRTQILRGRAYYLYTYRKLFKYFKYRYWFLFTTKIIKLYLGYIKDFAGFNPMLKR
ncbi:MAG: glycosyltransferase [Saprospiraceae bacterium]|nr:glycosyltransferase [Saprospiraceae bacterium]